MEVLVEFKNNEASVYEQNGSSLKLINTGNRPQDINFAKRVLSRLENDGGFALRSRGNDSFEYVEVPRH